MDDIPRIKSCENTRKLPHPQYARPRVRFCLGAELDEVTAATILWRETVTCGLPDAPEKTAALYAEDAVFWGTVSEGVRDTPELVYDYFVSVSAEPVILVPSRMIQSKMSPSSNPVILLDVI